MPSRSSKRKAFPTSSSHTICTTSWKKSVSSSSKPACWLIPFAAWAIFPPPIENAAASAPPSAASAVPCSPPATITKCPKKSCSNGNAPKKKTARSANKNSKTANICSFRNSYRNSANPPVGIRTTAGDSRRTAPQKPCKESLHARSHFEDSRAKRHPLEHEGDRHASQPQTHLDSRSNHPRGAG